MVNEKLRSYRKNNKLTQKELAKILEIDRSTYAYYENGKRTPSIGILSKLSRIYNVPMDYLLGNADVYDFNSSVLEDDSTFYNKAEKEKVEKKQYLSEIYGLEQEALLIFRLIQDKEAALKMLREFYKKEG